MLSPIAFSRAGAQRGFREGGAMRAPQGASRAFRLGLGFIGFGLLASWLHWLHWRRLGFIGSCLLMIGLWFWLYEGLIRAVLA